MENSQKHDGPKALKPSTKPFFSVYWRAYLEGLMRFAADEGVGLGTAFQNFGRFLNEFSVAIQFADVALQWRKISWWQDRMTPRPLVMEVFRPR